jgi:hypothetical protein
MSDSSGVKAVCQCGETFSPTLEDVWVDNIVCPKCAYKGDLIHLHVEMTPEIMAAIQRRHS